MAINDDDALVDAKLSIGGQMFPETTVKELILGESLLTPGLQTAVTLQSQIYGFGKEYDKWKGENITIGMARGQGQGSDGYMSINQVVYRLDNREFMPVNVGQTEEFTIHACDKTLLTDAKTLVSKSWKCEKPSAIVSNILEECVGARDPDVESAGPTRDYIAENIHPFQVVAQQANVALAGGDDPSFVHYMTFGSEMGGMGRHHFRSLKSLCKGTSKVTFVHNEGGITYNENLPSKTVNSFVFSFPCDFDYLADLLNGNDRGKNINTFAGTQLLTGAFNAFGNQAGMKGGCGIGGGNYKMGMTNAGSAGQQNGCEMKIEQYLLKRQARMSLLEKDKIALRITGPWQPSLHVGDIITLYWRDKVSGNAVYGSGDYLISALTHKIQLGGHAVTTLDCVSTTVGEGIV